MNIHKLYSLLGTILMIFCFLMTFFYMCTGDKFMSLCYLGLAIFNKQGKEG
jgi:hypothetical protein